jgi:hypothetical protein
MPKLIEVGTVAIDSGVLHVGDPLYLDEHPYEDWEETAIAVGKAKNGVLTLSPDFAGLAVTNFGDGGDYPVYIEQSDDGRTLRLVIDFCG